MNESGNLSGVSSLFSDSLRIIAALKVLYIHAAELSGKFYTNPDTGYIAVIVFFVLSGFAIAHTTSRQHRNRLQYAITRLSRLYSIVLPSIIITAIIQIIIWKIQPDLYNAYTRGSSLPRYFSSTFFLSEIWFFSASPPINGPLWSLSFEFWYYTIFGFFFFRNSNSIRSFLFPTLACLIAGPKILIMMPIWLSGNFTYRTRRPLISDTASWIFIFASLSVMLAFIFYSPAFPFQLGKPPLYYASQFITDIVSGLFIAFAFWLLPTVLPASKIIIKEKKWIRILPRFANLTFPIYVLHLPLIVLWHAVVYKSNYKNFDVFIAFISVLITAVFLGIIMEKYRFLWTNIFTGIANYLDNVYSKVLPVKS